MVIESIPHLALIRKSLIEFLENEEIRTSLADLHLTINSKPDNEQQAKQVNEIIQAIDLELAKINDAQ